MLAKRFAVKEAATKALGTGQAQDVLLRHFYVLHNDHGKPELYADSEAKVICEKQGINSMHVSISDENEYAIAQVILERVPWKTDIWKADTWKAGTWKQPAV